MSQPRLAELFTVGNRRGANDLYQATTGWLVLLTWPLFLMTIIFGPEVLELFGRSYRSGADVMVVLGFSMLLATACGQVDVVLITIGRSSWSLANGLLTLGVNIGVDVVLIPRDGIMGAAIGWAIAIAVSNLVPLGQLAAAFKLHPFGRAAITACGLTTVAFGVIPLLTRVVLGTGPGSVVIAFALGSLVGAAGLWRFRRVLSLPDISIGRFIRFRSSR